MTTNHEGPREPSADSAVAAAIRGAIHSIPNDPDWFGHYEVD